jgi:hypothetical protein
VAVYINPAYERTVTLVQSVIAASGGYHIAHGEDGLYLSDPYFPKAERPSKALAKQLKRLADFGVAYSELLTFACPVDVKAQMDESLWLIPRRVPGKLILNLINASPQDRWDRDLAPALSSHVRISIPVENTIEQVWMVSPDEPSPPQQLDFSQGNNLLNFEVPEVNIWTLVCIQFTPTVESEQ